MLGNTSFDSTLMQEAYSKDDLDQAVETLRRGGIILYPTDTVWGIGCDATNEEAVPTARACSSSWPRPMR